MFLLFFSEIHQIQLSLTKKHLPENDENESDYCNVKRDTYMRPKWMNTNDTKPKSTKQLNRIRFYFAAENFHSFYFSISFAQYKNSAKIKTKI